MPAFSNTLIGTFVSIITNLSIHSVMSRLKTVIGILILFTYLCPFVSCNKEVAIAPAAVKDTVVKTDTTISTPAETAVQEKNHKKEFWAFLLFPTEDSVSGLGEALNFDDNETSRFLLVSLLLSITIVVPFKNHYRVGRILIVAVNLACIIAFMYFTAIVEKEALLWGMWLLLALVTIQLLLELKYKPGVVKDTPEGQGRNIQG